MVTAEPSELQGILPSCSPALAAALVAALGEMTDPPKTRTAKVRSDKGNYEYDYADLPGVLQHVRPVLAKHGLALMHDVKQDGGRITVSTWLLHASGDNTPPVVLTTPGGPRVQDLGGTITYLRRYGITTVCGIAADADDDANTADSQAAVVAPKRAPAKPPEELIERARAAIDAELLHHQVAPTDALRQLLANSPLAECTVEKLEELAAKFSAPSERLRTWVADKTKNTPRIQSSTPAATEKVTPAPAPVSQAKVDGPTLNPEQAEFRTMLREVVDRLGYSIPDDEALDQLERGILGAPVDKAKPAVITGLLGKIKAGPQTAITRRKVNPDGTPVLGPDKKPVSEEVTVEVFLRARIAGCSLIRSNP